VSKDAKGIIIENKCDNESSHGLRRSRKVVSYKDDDFDLGDIKIPLLSSWNRALPSSSQQSNSNSNALSPRKERKERKDLLCPYCEKDLLNKENYEGHINAKHEKKFCYKCPDSACSYVSLWRKGFRDHLLNSHKIEPKNNEEIDNKYKHYERHLISSVRHKRTSDEPNHEQGENDDSQQGKIGPEHKKMPINSMDLTISSDEYTAKTDASISMSKDEQHDANGKSTLDKDTIELTPLSCTKCNDTFTDESSWAAHMESKHNVPQHLLLCPECEYDSQHKLNFINHLVKIHAYDFAMLKNVGGYQVTMKERAPLIKAEKGQPQACISVNGEYSCPRCDYTYEKVNLLESHCKEGHGPHAWYLCPCCPYENRFLHGLREHLSKKHGNEANTWGSNLEGRKIDKRRFRKNEQGSPPPVIINTQLGKTNVNPTQIFSPRNLTNVTKPVEIQDINSKSKDNEDCIIISDD